MQVVLRIKKNKFGAWPFVRDNDGKKMVFSSFTKARDHAKTLDYSMWRATRIDLIRPKLY